MRVNNLLKILVSSDLLLVERFRAPRRPWQGKVHIAFATIVSMYVDALHMLEYRTEHNYNPLGRVYLSLTFDEHTCSIYFKVC